VFDEHYRTRLTAWPVSWRIVNKRWVARPVPALELVDAPNPLGLPPSMALLLARRGYTGDRLYDFLHPDIGNLFRWSDIRGIKKAVSRLTSAVIGSEKVMVHGDFDADGITATAVVCLGLKALDADVTWFIPRRFEDGYGLGDAGVKACIESGASLLLTVDCGISGAREVGILADAGVDVVITDHHQYAGEPPPAYSVVNPALEGDVPHGTLAGVGVAWMLMRGLYHELGRDEDILDDLLQLVAVGTLADVVDLSGANRILVAEGMKRIRKKPLAGIGALLKSASRTAVSVTSEDLSYYVAPRINACGRVGDAGHALALLTAGNTREADIYVAGVEECNKRRRELESGVLEHLTRKLEGVEPGRCIVAADRGWHRGVVGIAASRLVSRFGVPSLVISIEGETGFGSARSVPGVPIHSILRGIRKEFGIMDSLGGHPMAAGFRLPRDEIPSLRNRLLEVMSGKEWDGLLGPVLYLDGRLEPEDFSVEMVRALEMMEPFGEGNGKPVWITRGAYPLEWRTVGRDGSHLSCLFGIGGNTYRGIGFGMAEYVPMLGDRVDLAFTLARDTWRGGNRIQLILKGIRKHRRRRR